MSGAFDPRRTCPPFRRQLGLSRRAFLHAGLVGSGGAGLSLAGLLRAEAAAAPQQRRAASVIILWMRGGPSHIDMWDPKPDAPAEFRGEFGTATTSVPGIQLTDMLPHSGRIMDKWSIVRSLHHLDAGHSGGDQILLYGLSGRTESGNQRHAQLRLDRGPAVGTFESRPAKLRDDSADGSRHRARASGCGLQAVRDRRRSGQPGPVSGAGFCPGPRVVARAAGRSAIAAGGF